MAIARLRKIEILIRFSEKHVAVAIPAAVTWPALGGIQLCACGCHCWLAQQCFSREIDLALLDKPAVAPQQNRQYRN